MKETYFVEKAKKKCGLGKNGSAEMLLAAGNWKT